MKLPCKCDVSARRHVCAESASSALRCHPLRWIRLGGFEEYDKGAFVECAPISLVLILCIHEVAYINRSSGTRTSLVMHTVDIVVGTFKLA